MYCIAASEIQEAKLFQKEYVKRMDDRFASVYLAVTKGRPYIKEPLGVLGDYLEAHDVPGVAIWLEDVGQQELESLKSQLPGDNNSWDIDSDGVLVAYIVDFDHITIREGELQVIADARRMLEQEDFYDFNLVVFMVRDLQVTKTTGMSRYAWSAYRDGYLSKADVEFLLDRLEGVSDE